MRRVNATPRRGMTLLELLVVMMIIAALASLVLSAVFAVRESQMKSFTETLVQKLASALDQQWKGATDQIRDEPVPVWALTMANGDPRIAKVIYLKARLKQEFPVSFFQAIYPNANFTPGQVAKYQTPSGTSVDLMPKSTYLRALGPLAAPAGAFIPAIGSTILPPDNGLPANLQGFEASALLYLTLSQGRRGVTGFNPDENVEPTAIRTATVGNLTFKYFVDSWGNPVRFWAFPYMNSELNESPYRQDAGGALTQNQQSPDPQDPERALQSFLTQSYAWSANFQAMVYPFALIAPSPTSPATNDLRTLIPVVGSAGRDTFWGVDYFLMGRMAPETGPTANEPALGYGFRADDDILSYRLRRVGRRGD